MTVIVGIADKGKVYIGGDRGHSDSHTLVSSSQPKIFEVGQYIIGYAGNTGIGQAIVHNFPFPAVKSSNIYKHMTTVFIPQLRSFIIDNNIKLPESDDDNAGFIVGVKGKIYEIDLSDYQCVEYTEVAIGTGSSYAYGSIYNNNNNPEERIRRGIEAAIHYSPSCSSPIDILIK